jgi:hypothetical protein
MSQLQSRSKPAVTIPGPKPETYWPTAVPLLLIPTAMVQGVDGVASKVVKLPWGSRTRARAKWPGWENDPGDGAGVVDSSGSGAEDGVQRDARHGFVGLLWQGGKTLGPKRRSISNGQQSTCTIRYTDATWPQRCLLWVQIGVGLEVRLLRHCNVNQAWSGAQRFEAEGVAMSGHCAMKSPRV